MHATLRWSDQGSSRDATGLEGWSLESGPQTLKGARAYRDFVPSSFFRMILTIDIFSWLSPIITCSVVSLSYLTSSAQSLPIIHPTLSNRT